MVIECYFLNQPATHEKKLRLGLGLGSLNILFAIFFYINLDYWLFTSTVRKYVIFSLLGVCESGDTLGTISNNNNDRNKNIRKA